jgi:Fe-S-cluster containining protein
MRQVLHLRQRGHQRAELAAQRSDILWYLYHEQVSIYRDGDGEWSVVFETRCRHLQGSLLCAVYPERPIICRDFDNTTCDVNDPEGGLAFATPEEFLAG